MSFEDIRLNDGHSIPSIAFGTGTALGGRDASDYVLQALDSGFDHIDTAQCAWISLVLMESSP
jgi:diketogulonate reductase-like aldo/keto reductase